MQKENACGLPLDSEFFKLLAPNSLLLAANEVLNSVMDSLGPPMTPHLLLWLTFVLQCKANMMHQLLQPNKVVSAGKSELDQLSLSAYEIKC